MQLMEQMDKQFEKMECRFDVMDKRFDKVESRIESLRETVENNATEFRSHFRHIERKLDHHDKMFEFVSEELSGKSSM